MKSIKRCVLFAGLSVVLVATLLGGGCAGNSVAAQGWSGIVGADGQLYYLTTIAGSGGGGFLGCGAPAPQGQMITLSANDGGVINTVTIQDSSVFYGTPVVSGGYAYVTGYNGRLYRVNVVSGGTPSGVYLNPEKPRNIIGSAAVADGRVYAASVDGCLYAFDTNLERQWVFNTGDQIWSTPVVDGNTVYIGSFDKKIYAVDATTGQEKRSYTTQGAVVATPVVAGGCVYIASLDRHVYALDATNGNLIWQFPTTGDTVPRNWFWATPVLVDGKLFVPNTDGQIYIINAHDGRLATEPINARGSIASSPVVVDGKVVVVTEEGDIYSIDIASLQFDSSPCRLRIIPANTGTSNASLAVRAPLATSGGLVYIQTTGPSRVFEYNPAYHEAKEIGTRQSNVTSSPPSGTVTVTVTVTTTG